MFLEQAGTLFRRPTGARGADAKRKQTQERQRPDESKKCCLHRCSSQTPEGLKDDGDDDRLNSLANARYRRELAKPDVEPSQTGDHQRCREDETATRGQQTSPTGAQVSDVNCYFARTGSRYEIACAKQVEEFFTGEPMPASGEFVLHILRRVLLALRRLSCLDGGRTERDPREGHASFRK